MKILFMARDKFPPFRVDITVLFADRMTRRGHKIDWIFQARERADKAYEQPWGGGRAHVGATRQGSGLVNRVAKNILDWLNVLRVFRILKKGKHDLVIVRDKVFGALPALLAARINRARFVLWLSFPFVENDLYMVAENRAPFPLLYRLRGSLGRIILYRLLFPAAAHVFVQTKYMRQMIATEYGIDPDTMTPVPMGVLMETIPAVEESATKAPDDKDRNIVYLGTLMKSRKLDFLVRAFAEVKKRWRQARLIFVGSGADSSDEEFLLDEAGRLDVADSVTITGHLEQARAWQIVRQAHVCVSPICPSPILDCGSPTKLIEYMALGKAVVANDHPEQKELLAESKAGLCVPWDEYMFAEAICFLLEHQQKAKLMGGLGSEYIKIKRNYDSMADIVEEKLLELNG